MQKKFINPADTHKPRGYTHAVVAEGGKVVFVAGQVAFDASGQLVGKGDLAAQARKAFENLFAALKAAGATPADIVKLNTYIVNYKPEDYQAVRELRAQLLPRDNPPASTLVGVQALEMEGLLIEIEAIAVIA
jgi:2-iminobutanoate/2-iminopropanoate deaminase